MAVINGTNGDDTLDGTNQADTISGLDGDDSLSGGARNDRLNGGVGNDTLIGGSGADTLLGGADDDFIDPGINRDYIDGGDGVDTVTFENSGQNITLNVDLNTGSAFLNNNTTETIINVENVIGSNTAIGDVLTGNGQDNELTGLAGTDSLSGGDGSDRLDGGTQSDTLDGGSGDDTLIGGDGSDLFIWDGASNDVIIDFGVGNTGAAGDEGVTTFTGDNDFVDLTGVFNDRTLSAYNAAAGTNFATAFGAMNDDIADGVIDFNGTDFSGPTLSFTGRDSLEIDETGVVCFSSETMIATQNGEVRIDQLRQGDLIQTMDNELQPLVMVACRKLCHDTLTSNPKLKPLILSAGLFGVERSLVVSPQHAMLVKQAGEEVLVRATHMADARGGQVRRMQGCRSITYVHLVFDAHQIIFANGRPAESMFPGPQALSSMTKDALAEFNAIFPDMFSPAGQRLPMVSAKQAWCTARSIAKRKAVHKLSDLHAV
ncbi:Hemolysin-type calcium-binding repeat-containing protein [Monaibacterium marinum]|uniref:Hemolysin-type calcium-binding repeat-containing protein n=1 Tax=Pontivivens marinum TaxID=1690039 RepID=A0A2C9CUN1_9RHOB|nr:Hint domain-containing protein [Monaibacterium marinum]SOH94835.1 Hemolysin-type calcium-binding repeat-containing protein [Monaibacterium marinum]